MVMFPQVLLNVKTQGKSDLQSDSSVQAAVKLAQKKLADRGRVLLRPSGTEPVMRVMVEGEDPELVASLAEEVARVVARSAAA